MCTYIYTLHKDCLHKQYQNTFKCLSARLLLNRHHSQQQQQSTSKAKSASTCSSQRVQGDSNGKSDSHSHNVNLTLGRTIHLPDHPSTQVPCDGGEVKRATRPVPGRCRACVREERELKMKLGAAQRAMDDENVAAGVRNSVIGLQRLLAATKPLDLEE